MTEQMQKDGPRSLFGCAARTAPCMKYYSNSKAPVYS